MFVGRYFLFEIIFFSLSLFFKLVLKLKIARDIFFEIVFEGIYIEEYSLKSIYGSIFK